MLTTKVPVKGRTLTSMAVATIVSAMALPALAEQREAPFSDMMDETSVDLSLRNFYFNRDYQEKHLDKDSNNKKPGTVESWSQAARLDLKSGYFDDLIGFDASLFGNLKLVGDEEKFGSGALRPGHAHPKNGKIVADQKSYSKLGQAYLKARFGNDDLNANLKAGRMFIDTPLLNDNDSRATPSTTQGIYGEMEACGLEFYGLYSDKASDRTESGFHSYKNDNGDTWKVGIIGAKYSLDELTLHASTGKADKFKKQNFLNASYTLDLGSKTSLMLDGYYQTVKDDGHYYTKNGGKLDSKLWNLATQLSVDSLSFLLSYQSVIGDELDYDWGGSDNNGLVTWNAVQILDFNRKDEKSWQARIDYSFDSLGIPGLKLMTRYVHGSYKDKDTKKQHEWERNTDLSYTFSNSSLDGLSITWRNATVHSADKSVSLDENRLIVNYTLPII
ncbi:OprD family outer membrane porin [Sansalvadorimonas verongulae]|uniref:OprD family outer membrane porin n=1 Tax=Sansalvadorimonas verongulae TaxID=2172824 RepID=UPI0012BD6F5C|nr:OprD family outer membrane porin [Sansalvadorimonas verongulae]MTI12197.1 outer membrane porin, OprD family [Sansalvadorimonas verongulae]